MNMYIGNLAYDVTENDLRNAFSEFGEVSTVKIITDKFSGRSKGVWLCGNARQLESRPGNQGFEWCGFE